MLRHHIPEFILILFDHKKFLSTLLFSNWFYTDLQKKLLFSKNYYKNDCQQQTFNKSKQTNMQEINNENEVKKP